MIGNEKINPDLKFIEVFKRLARIEAVLADIQDRISEVTAVLGTPPEHIPRNGRSVLSLKK